MNLQVVVVMITLTVTGIAAHFVLIRIFRIATIYLLPFLAARVVNERCTTIAAHSHRPKISTAHRAVFRKYDSTVV